MFNTEHIMVKLTNVHNCIQILMYFRDLELGQTGGLCWKVFKNSWSFHGEKNIQKISVLIKTDN